MASFSVQNVNFGSLGGFSTQPVLEPTPVIIPTAPRANTGLTGSVSGALTGGTSTQILGTTGTGSTGTVNTGTTQPINTGNTGTINAGSGAIQRSREELERALQTNTTPTTAQPTAQTFWEKYKVWLIPGIALLVIAIAMYFYFKK
jgi:hypothetical protein